LARHAHIERVGLLQRLLIGLMDETIS
jgi:hypothetical protein